MDHGLSPDEFDEDALAELRDDLGDAFPGFVERFIASARSTLDEIDASLLRGDRDSAMAQAHSLRGTTGYLGAIAMGNALDALQHVAERDEGRDDARRHAADARDAFIKIEGRLMPPS